MRQWCGLVLALFFLPFLCAGEEYLETSPVHLEDHFSQGILVNTDVSTGSLQLQAGASHGYWISPAFTFQEGNINGLWNWMEGEANWDEFGLNLVTECPDFDCDQQISPWTDSWMSWSAVLVQRDCSQGFSGCSIKISYPYPTIVWPDFGTFGAKVWNNHGLADQHNIFRVMPGDTIHFTARIKADMKHATLKPTFHYLRRLPGQDLYTSYYPPKKNMEFFKYEGIPPHF
jgi:hypothetical protein